MSETNQYHHGTPNIEEWGALWKDSIHDKDAVEGEEFDLAYRSLESCLAKIGKVGFERGCDFYVLGDSLRRQNAGHTIGESRFIDP